MHLTAVTSVTLHKKALTAYAGPSFWPDVPVGIYFNFAEVSEILGAELAPSIDASLPSGEAAMVCSGSLVTHALYAQEERKDDWRAVIIATREADEAFGNAPMGYRWQVI